MELSETNGLTRRKKGLQLSISLLITLLFGILLLYVLFHTALTYFGGQ